MSPKVDVSQWSGEAQGDVSRFVREYVAKHGVRLVRTSAAWWAMFLNWKMRRTAGL